MSAAISWASARTPPTSCAGSPSPTPLGDLEALPLDMLKIVHFKQMRNGEAWPSVDEGDLDCREMRDILEAKGYQGPAIMEIPPHSDVFSNLEASFSYLR